MVVVGRIQKILSNPELFRSFIELHNIRDGNIEETSANTHFGNSSNSSSNAAATSRRRLSSYNDSTGGGVFYKLESKLATEVKSIYTKYGILCVSNNKNNSINNGHGESFYVHAQVVDQPIPISSLVPDHKRERERIMNTIGQGRSALRGGGTAYRTAANITEECLTVARGQIRRLSTVSSNSSSSSGSSSYRFSMNMDSLLPASSGHFSASQLSSTQQSSSSVNNLLNIDPSDLQPDTVITVPYSIVRRALHEGHLKLLG